MPWLGADLNFLFVLQKSAEATLSFPNGERLEVSFLIKLMTVNTVALF